MKFLLLVSLLILYFDCSAMNLERSLTQLLHDLQTLYKALQNLPIAGPSDLSEQFRLPILTETQQAAGVKGSQYYNKGALDFKQLHTRGHIEDETFLDVFFFNSVFNYYVHEFLGYDPTYDYLMWKDRTITYFTPTDMRKFQELARSFGIREPQNRDEIELLFPVVESIDKASAAFDQNKLLQDLGISFQRQKVVVEKLETVLKELREPMPGELVEPDQAKIEKVYELMLARDRIATDIQAMIYHFMKEAFAEYKKRIKTGSDAEKLTAGNFLKDFKPSFINQPYYKRIIDRLNELMKPTNKVDGFDLAPTQ